MTKHISVIKMESENTLKAAGEDLNNESFAAAAASSSSSSSNSGGGDSSSMEIETNLSGEFKNESLEEQVERQCSVVHMEDVSSSVELSTTTELRCVTHPAPVSTVVNI